MQHRKVGGPGAVIIGTGILDLSTRSKNSEWEFISESTAQWNLADDKNIPNKTAFCITLTNRTAVFLVA